MLAFAADEDKTVENPTCIRCGRCVEACPCILSPSICICMSRRA